MMRFLTKTHFMTKDEWILFVSMICLVYFCFLIYIDIDIYIYILSYMCSCSFIFCSFLFSDFAVFSCMIICFYMCQYILSFVATAEIQMLYQLETRNWVTCFTMIGIDWCRKAVYATNI